MNPTDNVRHAIKAQWDWTRPGRPRPALRHATCTRFSTAIVGGWEFSGAGRIQARMVNFGNVRLVGMTPKDLQEMYKFDIRDQPGQRPADAVHAAGRRHPQHAPRVQHQPDVGDRLLRSRRARGPLLRAGQQRRLHPAQGGRLRAADAAHPRAVLHARRHRRDEAVPDRRAR